MTMTRCAAKATLALLFAGLSLFAPRDARAVDERDLLPVDQAFALEAKAASRERIDLTWQRRARLLPVSPSHRRRGHRFRRRPLALPKGKAKRDEFFGDVETYRDLLSATYTGHAQPGVATVSLKVKYQGCADVGVCYPPQVRTLDVALPGGRRVGIAVRPGEQRDALARLARSPSPARVDAMPLPPEQAFNVEAIAPDGNEILLRFTPAPGYYVYRDKTQLKLDAGDGIALRSPKWPKGTQHRDEHFGDVVVYFDQFEVPVPRAARACACRRRHVVGHVPGLPGRRHLLSADDAHAGAFVAGGHRVGRPAPTTDRTRRRPALARNLGGTLRAAGRSCCSSRTDSASRSRRACCRWCRSSRA